MGRTVGKRDCERADRDGYRACISLTLRTIIKIISATIINKAAIVIQS
jgi:hypothetical protein